jgi:hypothetical protein
LLVPSEAPRAELPPPGTDVLNVAVSIEITVNPGPSQIVPLIGQMTLRRGIGDPGLIPIEIVSLNLTGMSPALGRVQATLDPHFASGGQVAMLPPTETPADSFFDVWFDINLPDMGRSFYQSDWYNIQSRTTAIPFFDVFSETFSEKVSLIDQVTGMPAGSMTHVSLNPHPRINRLTTQAQVDWTLGTTREIFQMGGQSLVVASESWADPGPINTPSFNTEIVAMDLSGASPSRGPLQFTEQVQLHSPGQTVATQPGPQQFPANSFFDVFFDLHNAAFDVFCTDRMTGKATINGWPPLGTTYLPPGPCKLFDRATGAAVGTLNGFQWVFTDTAGGCVDADGDGVFAPPCGTDCDDNDPNNFPGNLENCTDGRDNNCNQLIDCRDPVCTGRTCDDGDRCTRPDVCTATGTCVGQPVDCNDNDPCTLDRCNPNTGLCEHVPVNCDDQNPCTADSCVPSSGQCRHDPIVCDDNNPCTQDACDPATGQCKFTPVIGQVCNDGDPCTQNDLCVQVAGGVVCQGTPINCDDNNSCTRDFCDPATGLCRHDPLIGQPCDDGNLCTQNDVCVQIVGDGVVCRGTPVGCEDSNPCTQDFCDPATGLCRHDPLVGVACDDGNACTQDDRCVQIPGDGVGCQGTPVNCDDQNPCTQDHCEPAGCIVPDNGTGTATLPPGTCAYLTQNDMMIINGLPAGTTINIPAVHRNFICTGGGGPSVCSFPVPIPGVDCDQPGGTLGGEEECADSILELHMMGTGALAGFNRVINVPVGVEEYAAPRTPGDPVQSFNALVSRLQGQLPPGDPDFDLLRIVGGNDFGMPSPGHTILSQQGGNWAVDSFFDITYRIDFIGHMGSPLAGMSGSTTGTSRFRTPGGGCVHVPVDCDDQNPCTVDSCDPATGTCLHTPVNCDDGNDCTRDFCDPASGACKHDPLVGASCDDGNACTQDDRCVQTTTGGVVCQGTPVDCDDRDPCTQDRCDPSGCIAPDNGTGTADLPPHCPYFDQDSLTFQEANGDFLMVGPAVHRNFTCPPGPGPAACTFPSPIPGVDCSQPGGSLGGEEACADSILTLKFAGLINFVPYNRSVDLPVSFEMHAAPRTPGDPVQSFNTDMFRLFGEITPADGDPDFDLLRITAGTDFGLPSPGHTILNQQGGNWAVDSFFDITFRIDIVGKPSGPLAGWNKSVTQTWRFRTAGGGCVHVPVDCDDQDPCTADRCNPLNGQCEHQPLNCDDGNPCTKDFCDPTSGLCRHDPQLGAPCDDGNVCTQDDTCVQNPFGGIGCQGTPLDCDDQNPCTFDRCDPANGQCVHILNTCDDGNACTQDACDPATGQCLHRPIPVLEPSPINFRDQVTIFWGATPDATHWNTYRGTIPQKLLGSRLPGPVYDQACYESDDSGANGPTIAIDLANPPLGSAFYYLVSGENACGESDIGHPSAPPGAMIPNTLPCPTPP